MKRKYMFAFAAFCAVLVVLLSLWAGGLLITQDADILPAIQKEIEENGIYAEMNADPEAGILPGDILTISWEIFFDPDTVSVDENIIAEEYVKFREGSLKNCEEYSASEVNYEKPEGINKITVISEFQCWITQAREVSLHAQIQYIEKENANTSVVYLSKKLSFADIPASVYGQPRPLAEHVHTDNRLALWLIICGSVLFISGGILGIIKMRLLSDESKVLDEDGGKSHDYFTNAIAGLRARLAKSDTRIVSDRLYHICLKIESERGNSQALEELKAKIRKAYEGDTRPEHVELLIGELEKIIKDGGEAK